MESEILLDSDFADGRTDSRDPDAAGVHPLFDLLGLLNGELKNCLVVYTSELQIADILPLHSLYLLIEHR